MKKRVEKSDLNYFSRAAMWLIVVALFSAAPSAVEAGCPTARAPVDFDGDNRTDYVIVRNTGGGAGGQITWFVGNSGNVPPSSATPWGISSDTFIPVDFDGDTKSDYAVWRSSPTFSAFYILQSQTNTLRAVAFGITGDQPAVTGDYTGDGKADPAVYRGGANTGNPSFWYYLASSGPAAGNIVGAQWGTAGDFPAPGDYDGDGRRDVAVQRGVSGSGVFYINQTTAGFSAVQWGTPSDRVVPGDYDGDCKTDIAVARTGGGQWNWYIRRSTNAALQTFIFGASATDFLTQGDYDGDGITDVSVWRSSPTPGVTSFYWRRSIDGATNAKQWGQQNDYPVANYNVF